MRTIKFLASVILAFSIMSYCAFGQNLIQTIDFMEHIDDLAINGEGHLLAVSTNFKIVLWDLNRGEESGSFLGHVGLINSIDFSPDGKQLASGSEDENVEVWDVKSRAGRKLSGHTNGINAVAFSPDGKYLVSGSDDKKVIVWDLSNYSGLWTLKSHKRAVLAVAFSPDCRFIASGSADNTIKIWDFYTGQEITTLVGHEDKVIAVSFDAENQTLASAGLDKVIRIWTITDWAEIKKIDYNNKINDMAFSSSPKMLLAVGNDKKVKIWKLGDFQDELITLTHSREVENISFSEGNTFAVNQADNIIKVYQFPYSISGSLEFVEPSGNGLLDACESGKIVLTLKNTGITAILKTIPELTILETVPGISLDFPPLIPRIAFNQEIKLEKRVSAQKDTPSGKIALKLSAKTDSIEFDSLSLVEFHSKAMSAEFSFTEPSGNSMLDSKETGMLYLKIKNEGNENAVDISVNFNLLVPVPGAILSKPRPINLIPARGEYILNTPIKATEDLLTGEVILKAEIISGDTVADFDPPAEFKIITNGLKPANLIVDISINDQSQNGQIESMEVVEIMNRVMNTGQLTAKNASLEITLDPNVYYVLDEQNTYVLGDIAGGENKDIRFEVYTNIHAQDLKYDAHIEADGGKIDKQFPINLPFNTPLKRIDIESPQIVLTEPGISRGMKIYHPLEMINIKGTAIDNIGISKVLVNDQLANLGEGGVFSLELYLKVGENKLIIDAYDLNLNSEKDTFMVVRQDESILTQSLANRDPNDFGNYHALIIAVQDYMDNNLSDLDYPVQDAQKLVNTLQNKYTFEPQNITFLKNPDRATIIRKMVELKNKLTEKDNLLVFYAGHGYWDDSMQQGYWLPSTATSTDNTEWLSNSDVRDYVRGIKTKHTLLVADACFSGGIFKTRDPFINPDISIQKIYETPSRKAITSGALKSVPDRSVFVEYLVKKLDDNTDQYIYSEKLFTIIKEPVINNSPIHQTPLFGVISETGDEGGDFIFIKRQ